MGYRGKCEVVLERENRGLLWRVKGVGVRRGNSVFWTVGSVREEIRVHC